MLDSFLPSTDESLQMQTSAQASEQQAALRFDNRNYMHIVVMNDGADDLPILGNIALQRLGNNQFNINYLHRTLLEMIGDMREGATEITFDVAIDNQLIERLDWAGKKVIDYTYIDDDDCQYSGDITIYKSWIY